MTFNEWWSLFEQRDTVGEEHLLYKDLIRTVWEEALKWGDRPPSGVAGVMARVRSEEPPDERGQYWLEEEHPFQDGLMPPEMKWVRYGPPQQLVVKPGPGHGKPVEEVDGLWTGPIPKPKQISERREAP